MKTVSLIHAMQEFIFHNLLVQACSLYSDFLQRHRILSTKLSYLSKHFVEDIKILLKNIVTFAQMKIDGCCNYILVASLPLFTYFVIWVLFNA